MVVPEEHLRGEELSTLLSQKGNTCISIILPLAKYGPEREQNQRIIDKAIQKAEQLWQQSYPGRSQQPWLSKILQLKEKLDPVHPPQSVGFFVSEQIQLVCSFPFLTREKIVIGTSFEIRDLVKKQQEDQPYLLLTLTFQKAQLYQAHATHIALLKQTGLGRIFKEAFEYSRPSRSTSYAGQAHVKSFEKEKQEVIDERAMQHFKKVDEIVRHYITGQTPVVVVADRKPLALYKKVSTLEEHLLLFEEQDPAHLSEHQLGICSWPRVKKWLDSQLMRLLEQYDEAVGAGRTREGLQACWRAAQEGNCLYLLVDESYQAPGFLASDEYYLFRKPPLQDHRIITDAVDDLIELVLEKKGHVLLTEPDSLPLGKKTLLITRY
jgi:hypothetical protein